MISCFWVKPSVLYYNNHQKAIKKTPHQHV